MQDLILEDGSQQRNHRQRLNDLLASTVGMLRFASAYVTDRELLACTTDRERRLLISLLPMDVASGATSLETLGALINSGVQCRVLPDRPRLHAKVYIFGVACAIVTSANLTGSAFDSNIEVGVEVKGSAVKQLTTWFDRLWGIASPLTVSQLSELQRKTISLRRDYIKLKKKTKTKMQVLQTRKPSEVLSDRLQDLFATASRFFMCNTDRRQRERTSTGGYALEQEMYNRGFATAWETFKFPSHMEQVEPGDAIFMFAKGVGIIGIGIAKARCETLMPNDPDRVRNFSYEENTSEWRVPVQWLTWTDEAGAYRCKAPNFTFYSIYEFASASPRTLTR
jgi:hypothetical protein